MITGRHQPRVDACLIGTQGRFCTAWTLERVLGFAFICFYICQVELLEASKLLTVQHGKKYTFASPSFCKCISPH